MSEPNYSGDRTDFYVAPKDVAEKVNLAVRLGRPILVEGEPGCGKTMLAYSIAKEKKLGDPVKIAVKSTSRAQDLLYRFNALRRLQDAQNRENKDAPFIYPYLSLGPLGEAIHGNRRSVVLIDEVDKADIDFPNDLLDVLDNFSFTVEDLPPSEEADCLARNGFGRVVRTEDERKRPIVVITSNREKRLPEPFLRRCIYVRLRFPDTPGELIEIVEKNLREDAAAINRGLVEAAVGSFRRVRDAAVGVTQKPPTTSELIDWVKILYWRKVKPATLGGDSLLPPGWEMLFKSMADLDAYETLAKQKQGTR
jgi:MoxR-like ATPase